ncbi:MAG: MFS transporter, partial [Gemmatimonadetes bacterium]|nr:MFS transporter [Gemmatimonadota bacterium]
GWLVGIPVPLVLMWAPSWNWILLANILLGANQALTWSMTVVMKVDLASPATFGRVIGWNEFAGYAGLAATAGATGLIASTLGLRPAPFYLGVALAVAGLLLSLLARETREETEAERPATRSSVGILTVLARGTWSNAQLAVASAAGLATNFKDGVLWGLLPMILVDQGMSLDRVGLVVGTYPLFWAVSQLYFGPLSDRVGRAGLIAGGLVAQGAGVGMMALGGGFGWFVLAAVVAGLGTGMVYPTLLAFVSDVAEPAWRASALGVYRFWRDSGYAAGALGGGLVADALGMTASLIVTAAVGGLAAAVFLSAAAPGMIHGR